MPLAQMGGSRPSIKITMARRSRDMAVLTLNNAF